MAVNFTSAISAYQKAASQALGQESAKPADTTGPDAGGGSFAGLVKDSLKSAIDINRSAETLSLKGLAGEADMRDVVMAVNNAENALSTVVAVRDKVVSAYQEILRMPI
jgi:flagellar hook-basal body complex protein FliE